MKACNQFQDIDSYIENAKPFAKEILNHLRKLVHQACPEVVETIKWGFAHFEHKGLLCNMAAFKEHSAFGFWKASILPDPHHILNKEGSKGMGHLGLIKTLADLPNDKILLTYIKEAVKINNAGIKPPKKVVKKDQQLFVPEDFLHALKNNKKAQETFEQFTHSKKNEYVTWVVEAKQQATRERRLTTAIEWLSEGKSKNWKYE